MDQMTSERQEVEVCLTDKAMQAIIDVSNEKNISFNEAVVSMLREGLKLLEETKKE